MITQQQMKQKMEHFRPETSGGMAICKYCISLLSSLAPLDQNILEPHRYLDLRLRHYKIPHLPSAWIILETHLWTLQLRHYKVTTLPLGLGHLGNPSIFGLATPTLRCTVVLLPFFHPTTKYHQGQGT
jgi:hypothetical protein